MERKKMITFITGGALVLVSVFGAVTSQVVKAQTTTPTPAAPTAPQAGGQPGFGRGMHGDGATEQDLATALGITLEKLQAAEQAATTAALKQAVADGTITQAQADQFAQSGQNGHLGGGLPFLRDSSIDTNALLAKELGISTADLQAARQKATFAELDQAVIAGRMTQQQADAAKGAYTLSANAKFQAAMTSAYQAAVNQAVTDGTITQAQADQLLKNATVQNWAAGGDRDGFGGRGGGPGGPGGQGGMNPFNGSAPANPGAAPTASPTTSGTNG